MRGKEKKGGANILVWLLACCLIPAVASTNERDFLKEVQAKNRDAVSFECHSKNERGVLLLMTDNESLGLIIQPSQSSIRTKWVREGLNSIWYWDKYKMELNPNNLLVYSQRMPQAQLSHSYRQAYDRANRLQQEYQQGIDDWMAMARIAGTNGNPEMSMNAMQQAQALQRESQTALEPHFAQLRMLQGLIRDSYLYQPVSTFHCDGPAPVHYRN